MTQDTPRNVIIPPEENEVVATLGFFDGVHLGHQRLIRAVRVRAVMTYRASAVITFDKHPRRVLGQSYIPQLLTTEAEKLSQLRATHADLVHVLPFDASLAGMSARDFLRHIHHTLHVRELWMGYDQKFGTGRLGERADYIRWGMEVGITVKISDTVTHDISGHAVSSSEIRRALLGGEPDRAAQMLGRPYRISGRVIHGKGLGTSLGFGTANLEFPPEKLVPKHGVYIARVAWGDHFHRPAVVNIGTKPTVDDLNHLGVEVHILDWQGALYDQELHVDLLQFLRPERKFDSLDLLRYQIQCDIQDTTNYLRICHENVL